MKLPAAAEVPMTSPFSIWLGCEVVLQVATGELRVPLRGYVVKESSDALRVRLEGCWDIDIFKEMIVGVNADLYGNSRAVQVGTSQVAERRAER